MSDEDMKAELERLKAENETLKKRSAQSIRLAVGKKGGASLYGLGHFPVTLYKEQWLKLLDSSDLIKGFLQENDAALKSKVID